MHSKQVGTHAKKTHKKDTRKKKTLRNTGDTKNGPELRVQRRRERAFGGSYDILKFIPCLFDFKK